MPQGEGCGLSACHGRQGRPEPLFQGIHVLPLRKAVGEMNRCFKMQSKEDKALQCGLQYRYKHNITLRKDNDTVYSGHSAGYAGTACLTAEIYRCII